MNLTEDELTLAVAARSGERGLLRALAVSLDVRLGEADVALDGAVAAWQAVGVRPRPFWWAVMARLSGRLMNVRRPSGGVESCAGRALERPKQATSEQPVMGHRPAA